MKLSEIKIWKLNVLDLAIILLVIISVGIFGAIHLKENDADTITAENSNVQTSFVYTISIKGLSNTSAEMFKVGDELYDKVSSTYIGKIKNLVINDATSIFEKNNGEIIMATVPNKIDVELEVETEGVVRNGEYLANSLIRILVGNFRELKTKYVMCSGTITSINRI